MEIYKISCLLSLDYEYIFNYTFSYIQCQVQYTKLVLFKFYELENFMFDRVSELTRIKKPIDRKLSFSHRERRTTFVYFRSPMTGR